VAESEKLVKRHNPVASLGRLGELGLDQAKYGSCSEKKRGNVGCAFWKSCPFARKWGNMAPFRGTRPHNIGYYIRPLTGPPKTDWVSCFGFCTDLFARMKGGMAEAAEGRRGEVIRIIGKEGDEIPMKIVKSFDPNCNKSLNVRLKVESVKVKIPMFLDPLEADPAMAYEMEIEKRFPAEADSLIFGGVADAAEVERLVADVSSPDIPMPDEPVLALKPGVKKGV
jgi:hypothetical protein